jgi:hypothetical protein
VIPARSFDGRTMLKRRLLIALALLMITLTVAATTPWLLYWIGLGRIGPSKSCLADRRDDARHASLVDEIENIPADPNRSDLTYSYLLQGRDMSALHVRTMCSI